MPESPFIPAAPHRVARSVRTRDETARVDTLRGLACLLVVAFHAIGAESNTGLHVADSSNYRGFCNLLMHVRMPLFAFLSGYVYALWPVVPGRLGEFARKKVRRLVIPLLTVTSIYYLLTRFLPYDKATPSAGEFWRIYLYPFAQYWFLQAMILVFALVALLDGYRVLDRVGRFWLVYALAVFACLGVRIVPNFFSADHMLELLPFFLLGLGVVRFRGGLLDRRTGVISLGMFAVLMAWYAHVLFATGGPVIPKRTTISFLIGTSGILALLHWFPAVPRLAMIGRYSFVIFLYHAFFAAGTRQVAALIGVAGMLPVVFSLCLAAGVIGPIVVERGVRHISWLAVPLLGQQARTGGVTYAAA